MDTKTKIKTMENINELFKRGDLYRIGYIEGLLAGMTAENAEKDLDPGEMESMQGPESVNNRAKSPEEIYSA